MEHKLTDIEVLIGALIIILTALVVAGILTVVFFKKLDKIMEEECDDELGI